MCITLLQARQALCAITTAEGGIVLIDKEGFRSNIGIIIMNAHDRLLWAKRIGQDAWQFPQGGMSAHETPEDTLFRELYEEIGLQENQVRILGRTRHWLRYRLPKGCVRHHTKPLCIGQKQLWFLLRLEVDDAEICLHRQQKPEFDQWQWVSYWYPLRHVVDFKQKVYRKALCELQDTVLCPLDLLWEG